MLDILHGDRVDAGKRLVEHDKLRVDGQAARYLRAATLTTRETVTFVLAHFLQAELSDQALELVELLLVGELRHLQHRHDIVLHRHLAKDAGFLRQVADAGARPLIHRIAGDLLVVDIDMALVGNDQSRGHIERCRLTGSVRTEEPDDLSLLDVERYVVGHGAAPVALH